MAGHVVAGQGEEGRGEKRGETVLINPSPSKAGRVLMRGGARCASDVLSCLCSLSLSM